MTRAGPRDGSRSRSWPSVPPAGRTRSSGYHHPPGGRSAAMRRSHPTSFAGRRCTPRNALPRVVPRVHHERAPGARAAGRHRCGPAREPLPVGSHSEPRHAPSGSAASFADQRSVRGVETPIRPARPCGGTLDYYKNGLQGTCVIRMHNLWIAMSCIYLQLARDSPAHLHQVPRISRSNGRL